MRKTLLLIFLLALCLCTEARTHQTTDFKVWAIRIAGSEMKHNPELWMADFVKTPKWDYTQGLMANAILQLYNETNDSAYYRYVKAFADFFINEAGEIKTYNKADYNIDKLNGGIFLYDLYAITRERKYVNAINTLREQLYTHPRVSEGAFWHKKVYPHQIWLDGLYMGSPFYVRYGAIFNVPEIFSDVTRQFIICDKYTLDPKTGLNYHGWDESKTQKWANPVTGQSPNFWSRSMGWYMMAMVDVLDYLPLNHPDRAKILIILKRLSKSLLKYQDKKTGMWYQVTNFSKRKGNYLESTGTAMFSYAFAKGVNNGYLPAKYKKYAVKAFDGLVKNSMIQNSDSTYSITRACSVAGLGGNPYRDGSYEYYIGEPVRNDDPKVLGPFIMAALELEKGKNQ
jgi:unsaturated rhamnogalacturonyl hydrolase